MQPQERDGLLRLCEDLALNANKTGEVVESLFDLSIFLQRPILGFLEQESVRSLLSDPELDTRQRADRFRNLVQILEAS